MFLKKLGIAAAALAISASGAFAAPFGPATAALSTNFSPTVTIGGSTSTINVTSPGGGCGVITPFCDVLINGTGSLNGTPYGGSSTGTITFSNTINTNVSNVIPGLFTFAGVGGNYIFDLAVSDTITFSNSGTSNQFGLYLLGTLRFDATDSANSLDATATSLTLTFNNTNNSAYSLSGSLSNPPVPPPTMQVPEPASIALLGLGLAGVGALRRRTRK